MIIRLVILCFTLIVSLPAMAKPLTTDISERNLSITTGFSGASLVLFGMADQPGGRLIIKVKGPTGTEIIRQKDRVAGLWLNHDRMVFNNVPGYYDISSSQPLHTLLDADELRQYGFGLDSLNFTPDARMDGDAIKIRRFNEALIQSKQLNGLFALGTHQITHLNPQLFRTKIWLPANVPIGQYTLTSYLIRDRAIVAQDSQTLTITQGGISGAITRFAHHQSMLYGLFAVFLAAFAGWVSNEMFRRD